MSDTIHLTCPCGAALKAELPENGFASPDPKSMVARWIELHRCGHEDTHGVATPAAPMLPARGETRKAPF